MQADSVSKKKSFIFEIKDHVGNWCFFYLTCYPLDFVCYWKLLNVLVPTQTPKLSHCDINQS